MQRLAAHLPPVVGVLRCPYDAAPRLFCSGLLLALPLASPAQNAAPAPVPRFYAGLAVYSSYYQNLGGGAYRPTRIPFQLTVGYQWRPRLAVQAGLAYSGTTTRYSGAGHSYTGTGVPGNYFEYSGRTTLRNNSISLLARYTLTGKPTHRVQFDVLGGLTWEHGSYRSYGTQADSVQNSLVASPYDYTNYSNALVYNLGPGVRVRLSPNLELTYDLLLSTSLVSNRDYFFQGVTNTQALGLRYRFGQR